MSQRSERRPETSIVEYYLPRSTASTTLEFDSPLKYRVRRIATLACPDLMLSIQLVNSLERGVIARDTWSCWKGSGNVHCWDLRPIE